MAKKRSKLADFGVYLVVRSLIGVLQAVPKSLAFAAADGLAWLAYRFNKRHREVAADNLRHAFPEKSAGEIDGLVRGCYRHFCTMLVEIVLLPRVMTVENYRDIASFVNTSLGVEAHIGRRPVLMVLGHFGNWEIAGYTLGALGLRTFAIARVLDNPYLDQFLNRFRQKTGQTIVAKNDDFGRLTDALKNGGKIATLADQDAGPRGVFVNFFGRPASAHKAVALMAMEFDALLLVIGTPRVGRSNAKSGFRSHFHIVGEEAIDPRDYAGRPDAVRAITQKYHDALERLVRQNPEQYFWLHRRWKSRPAVKKAKVELAAAA